MNFLFSRILHIIRGYPLFLHHTMSLDDAQVRQLKVGMAREPDDMCAEYLRHVI